MKKQTGFTLIELAIVLVIIGLLLGGVLRGQELINSAKVKNMARDFQNVQVYIYGYQDRFKALPGDDANAQTHLGAAAAVSTGKPGNGIIEGNWDSTTGTDESVIFWQHVRMAGFAPGSTTINTALPTNADGGRIGVSSVSAFSGPSGLTGAFVVCSKGILGKYAKQLDTMLDDGATDAGSVRAYADTTGSASAAWAPVSGTGAISDTSTYNVCMTF